MSALDLGPTNTTRYYTFTGSSLGSSDFCAGVWGRMTRNTAVGNQALFGLGTPDAVDSIYLRTYDTTNGIQAVVYNTTTSIFNTTWGTPLAGDDTDRLWIVQRRSNVIEVYVVVEDDTVSSPTQSSGTISGDITATNWQIGHLGVGSNYWENPIGEFFLLIGDSLTAAQVTTLAAGAQITAVKPSPDYHFVFRDGEVATEPNAGTAGGTAAKSAGWTGSATEVAEFFALTTPRIVVPTVAVQMR